MYLSVQSEIKALEKDVDSLRADKKNLKSELSQQRQDLNAHIDHLRFEKEQLEKQIDLLQETVTRKEREVVQVKAAEYDKVDVIKRIAELEAKNNVLTDEKDHLFAQRNEIEEQMKALMSEKEQFIQKIQEM